MYLLTMHGLRLAPVGRTSVPQVNPILRGGTPRERHGRSRV